jgi:hypothetical protein
MAGYLRVLEARNPATPGQRLLTLATDQIRPVRLYVARNLETPPEALLLLAVDDDSTVRWNVLVDVRIPAEALHEFARREAARYSDRVRMDRHLVARHPNVPVELRERLLSAGACDCHYECTEQRLYANRLRALNTAADQ